MQSDNLILTEGQWTKIQNWIPGKSREIQEEKVLEYLKEGSAAIKAKWPENNKKPEPILEEKSSKPEILRYLAIKHADPQKRREMIEEAELFVGARNIKECPIELRSAALLSENLHGRDIQLKFQAKQKIEEQLKTLEKNRLDMVQSTAWLNEGYDHRTNAYLIARKHKEDLLEMVKERKKQKDEKKATRISEEKAIIEMHNKNIEDKKVESRKMKEEQNEYMRKNEVETVLMAKQKRDRIKRENEVIDVLAKVHTEGKNKITEMIKQQEKQSKYERIQQIAKLGQMAKERHIVEISKLNEEQKMIEKARLQKEKVLDEVESKIQVKKDVLKNDRSQDYHESLKTLEALKSLKKQEDKEYFKTRIMNDVVSQEYAKIKHALKDQKVQQNLDFLKKQAKEFRQKNRQERKEDIAKFNKKINEDKTDQKFFEYANDLLEDAQGKNRPTKPIHQVIKSYKNLHFIDIIKKTRPHEISNVPINMEPLIVDGDKGKTKRRLKYERDEKLMVNPYRSTKFMNLD